MLLLSFPCCVFLGSYCTSFERKLSLPFFFLFRLLFRRCPPRFPRAHRAPRCAVRLTARAVPHFPLTRSAIPAFSPSFRSRRRPPPHRSDPSLPRIVRGSSHRSRPHHPRLFSVRLPCARSNFVGRSLHRSTPDLSSTLPC